MNHIGNIFSQVTVIMLLALCATHAAAQSGVVNDPLVALRSAKLIYVRSSSALVGASVIEAKLQKRTEFSQMGLVITRDEEAADVILEVHHDRFTKYVYTAVDRRTNMMLASGKLSSLGGTVADKVAKRFLKQVMHARPALRSSGGKPPSQLANENKALPFNLNSIGQNAEARG